MENTFNEQSFNERNGSELEDKYKRLNDNSYTTPQSTSSSLRTLGSSSGSGSSNLSPFAKEFIPRTVPMCSMSNTNPNMNGTKMWSNYREKNSSISANHDFDDFIALRYLKEFIDTIILKPNRFEIGIDYITDAVNSFSHEDDSVMESVVNAILDQAITDPQFRYNGVRLCIHFMSNLRARNPEKSFTILLFRRCQRESARRDTLINSSEETQNYLRGLTLFIADLYSRCSAVELAEFLPQLLISLLSNPQKENLKCVCQVLKLCGLLLEKYHTDKNTEEMNKVMDGMKASMDNPDISIYIKELVQNVIDMQKRGWTAPVVPNATPLVNPYLNMNINYPNTNSTNTGDYYEDYNYSDEEADVHTFYDFGQCGDEEDNEVCEAFEEFLKNSGQTN